MTGTNSILDRIAALLQGDTTTLANAAPPKVGLASAAFTPSPSLLLAGLTAATFQGYAPLAAGAGVQQEFIDPLSGLRVVQLLEPAGGWHWATTGAVGLPQTIFGFYVVDNGITTLYGSQLFTTPVVLTAAGQGVDIPQVRFTFTSPTVL